eukprot:9561044-Alexandrium_andersonii.AAC.1
MKAHGTPHPAPPVKSACTTVSTPACDVAKVRHERTAPERMPGLPKRRPWPNGSGLEPGLKEVRVLAHLCICERKHLPRPLEPGEPPPARTPQDPRSQETVKTKTPKRVTWAAPEDMPQIIELQCPKLDHNGVLSGDPQDLQISGRSGPYLLGSKCAENA